MISFEKILKQAWKILWSYRILWVFALLAGLGFAAGGTSSSSGSDRMNRVLTQPESWSQSYTDPLPADAPKFIQDLYSWVTENIFPIVENPLRYIGTIVTAAAVLGLILFIVGLIAAVIRYPAETALIRMVDRYEDTGEKLSFRQGWKLGWNERAFRAWWTDVLVHLPAMIAGLLIFGGGLFIVFSFNKEGKVALPGLMGAGIVVTIISALLLLLALLVILFWRNFAIREVILDDLCPVAAAKAGWADLKKNLKNTGIMGLILAGLGILFGIVSAIAFFILIPIYVIMVIPGFLVSVLPALAGYGIGAIFGEPLTWMIALGLALPVFFAIVSLPAAMVEAFGGLFVSNTWTLFYREIKQPYGALHGQPSGYPNGLVQQDPLPPAQN